MSISKERYDLLKRSGLCVSCGKKPPSTGSVLCLDCKAQRRVARIKYQTSGAEAGYKRKERAKYIEQGLCTICKQPVSEVGKWCCDECAYVRRIKAKIKRLRMKRGTWKGKYIDTENIALHVILEWKRQASNDTRGKSQTVCKENS